MGPFGCQGQCTLLLYILGIIGVTFDLGKIPTKFREKISGASGTAPLGPAAGTCASAQILALSPRIIKERITVTYITQTIAANYAK